MGGGGYDGGAFLSGVLGRNKTMSDLSMMARIAGGVIVAVNLVCVVAPAQMREALRQFPRSRLPAWVLLAFDVTWVTWVMLHAPLGRFEPVKPWLYAAAPAAFLLMAVFMDELLAPRALGGLLLLVANPVLAAARWHESNWRLVMTVVAYIWVVAGISLVLSPFRFRQLVEFGAKTNERCRMGGLVRLAFGIFVLVLAFKVY